MAYNYSQYVNALANMLSIQAADPNFSIAVPNIIDDAEQRTYRELDLFNTVQQNVGTFTPGTRGYSLPTTNGTILVVERMKVITPAGQTDQNLGTVVPMTPISPDALDVLWPNTTGSGVPQYWASTRQDFFLTGPWPDAGYTFLVDGTARPAPLSSTNVTTILTQFFPDVFMAASLVFGSGYMKNFGAMQGDPQSGMSWEQHLQALMQSAQTEEQRKKFNMAGWSGKQPAPSATPPRT